MSTNNIDVDVQPLRAAPDSVVYPRFPGRTKVRDSAAAPDIDTIVKALGGHRNDSGWMCHCPAHDDQTPSLSVNYEDGKVLVHCQTGCSQDAVVSALKARGLWPKKDVLGTPVATYDYEHLNRELAYQICKYLPKTFRQRRPDARAFCV
jgi:hypothetical protein